MTSDEEGGRDPRAWGQYYWFVWHTDAANYSNFPTPENKSETRAFVKLFLSRLPCANCRREAALLYATNPLLDSDLANADAYSRYAWAFHDAVNARLEKRRRPDFEQVRRWFDVPVAPSTPSSPPEPTPTVSNGSTEVAIFAPLPTPARNPGAQLVPAVSKHIVVATQRNRISSNQPPIARVVSTNRSSAPRVDNALALAIPTRRAVAIKQPAAPVQSYQTKNVVSVGQRTVATRSDVPTRTQVVVRSVPAKQVPPAKQATKPVAAFPPVRPPQSNATPARESIRKALLALATPKQTPPSPIHGNAHAASNVVASRGTFQNTSNVVLLRSAAPQRGVAQLSALPTTTPSLFAKSVARTGIKA